MISSTVEFRTRIDFASERIGLSVPFTKQESQTLVPSFNVKSTLWRESRNELLPLVLSPHIIALKTLLD
jgi:hypothetical protein